MKIQLIFLVVCVVTSFALPERRNFANRHSELTEQREELKNTNQESSNAGDEFIDVRDESVDEKTISSNEMITEKSKGNWMSRSQKNSMRKHWLKKHEGDRRHRNDDGGTALNNEKHQRPFFHTSLWQEKQTLFPAANPGAETRHHHHHHRNCTTTAVPPTTTAATTNAPLSEDIVQQLTPN